VLYDLVNSSPYRQYTLVHFTHCPIGIDHLELQEKYTYELLEYLEVLDPGRTWTKDQLLRNLQGIIIKKAHGVSKNIIVTQTKKGEEY
jgi:glycosylphosphatidylinositol transamidase (GPIT) subunit GPI8